MSGHDTTRGLTIQIRVSAEERRVIEEQANRNGKLISDWVRSRALGDALPVAAEVGDVILEVPASKAAEIAAKVPGVRLASDGEVLGHRRVAPAGSLLKGSGK